MTGAAKPIGRGAFREFHDASPGTEDFRRAVLAGLARPRKAIPCKYLYDRRGSQLFDEICGLDEYYPTRTEIALLQEHRQAIAGLAGEGASLIEFGSGSSVKVRIILDALRRPAAYIPVDISREHLLAAAEALARDYPGLAVMPVCADYTAGFRLPEGTPREGRLGFFPGSTIGNFTPAEAAAFLGRAAAIIGRGGGLLIGVDLQKDERILQAAYDDSRGVSAAFNLNLLARINRELGGDFDLDAFAHRARYDAAQGCMRMYLVSRVRQTATVAGRRFSFAPGEAIHTEDSWKFTVESFRALARGAGWTPLESWTDRDGLFSIHYLAAADSPAAVRRQVAGGGPGWLPHAGS